MKSLNAEYKSKKSTLTKEIKNAKESLEMD
jgi:hypothetical protein